MFLPHAVVFNLQLRVFCHCGGGGDKEWENFSGQMEPSGELSLATIAVIRRPPQLETVPSRRPSDDGLQQLVKGLGCSVCQRIIHMILTDRESVDPSVSPHPRNSAPGFISVMASDLRDPHLHGGKLQELPGNLRSLGLRGLQHGGAA